MENTEIIPLIDIMAECCPRPFASAMLSDEDATRAAAVFRALADPARVKLMAAVIAAGDDGLCVCDLAPALGLAQPTVSHHLRLLLEAGLLTRERSGTWAYYSARPEALAAMRAALVL